MKARLTALIFVVVGLMATPLLAEAPPQKPGKWQIKMQMEMPGVPMKLPAVNTTVCLTEEDLKDPQSAVPNDPKSDCEVGDYEVDGNTIRWTVDCPSQQMKGSGEITFNADGTGYEGAMKMSLSGQEMSTKYTATHQGACSK